MRRTGTRPTRLGLKLNFLIPSSSVVFLCFALSNLLGSSETSGVGCRLSLALSGGLLSLSRDRDGSGVTVSSRDSSGGGTLLRVSPGLSLGPPADEVVPHVTKDFNTPTRHSRLCLLNCGSVRPRPDVSSDPGTDSAFVFNAGGITPECAFEPGAWLGLVGSWFFAGVCVIGADPNFDTMLMKLPIQMQSINFLSNVIGKRRVENVARTARKCYQQPRCRSRNSNRSRRAPGDPGKDAAACPR